MYLSASHTKALHNLESPASYKELGLDQILPFLTSRTTYSYRARKDCTGCLAQNLPCSFKLHPNGSYNAECNSCFDSASCQEAVEPNIWECTSEATKPCEACKGDSSKPCLMISRYADRGKPRTGCWSQKCIGCAGKLDTEEGKATAKKYCFSLKERDTLVAHLEKNPHKLPLYDEDSDTYWVRGPAEQLVQFGGPSSDALSADTTSVDGGTVSLKEAGTVATSATTPSFASEDVEYFPGRGTDLAASSGSTSVVPSNSLPTTTTQHFDSGSLSVDPRHSISGATSMGIQSEANFPATSDEATNNKRKYYTYNPNNVSTKKFRKHQL